MLIEDEGALREHKGHLYCKCIDFHIDLSTSHLMDREDFNDCCLALAGQRSSIVFDSEASSAAGPKNPVGLALPCATN